MNLGRLILVFAATLVLGCRAAPRPIFPPVDPPLVWPAPPDPPRISYVGALYGESSLGAQSSGWQALRAVLAGPPPVSDFVRPAAVAVAGECVFVADPGRGAVHRLDLERRDYLMLTGNPGDPLRVPIDLVVVLPEQLLVADRARATVDVFDLAGNWQQSWHWPEITAPVSLAWDGSEQVWIADAAAHACFAVDLKTRQICARLGERGVGPGQFNYPTAVAYAPGVGLVVADAMNFRIQLFSDPKSLYQNPSPSKGEGREGVGRPTDRPSPCSIPNRQGSILSRSDQPPHVFGRKGDAAGDFARPRDVAIDAQGHIYILDNQFENIQVFTGDGRLLLAFGQGGTGPGEFAVPSGLTIDQHGRIWVADSFNRRVQVFQYLAEADQ